MTSGAGRVAVAPRLAGIFGGQFPVRDLAASRAWYEQVFGLDLIYESPDDDGVVRGVAFTAAGLGDVGIALREWPDIAGLSGFDPVVFAVDDRAAVEAWPRISPASGWRARWWRRRSGGWCCSTTPTGWRSTSTAATAAISTTPGSRATGARPTDRCGGRRREPSVGASTVSTVRLLHTADWHVGKSLKGVSRLDEQEQVLREIVRITREQEVDAVLVAGDLYDSAAPSAAAQRLVVRTLIALAGTGAQVVVIAGNHDHAATLDAYRPFAGCGGGDAGGRGAHRRDAAGSSSSPHAEGERATVAVLPFLSQRYAVRAAELVGAVPGGEHQRRTTSTSASLIARAHRRVPDRRGQPRDGPPDGARAARSVAVSAPHSRSSSTRCPRRSSRGRALRRARSPAPAAVARRAGAGALLAVRRWPSTSASRTTRVSSCWSRPHPPRRLGSPRSRSPPAGGCGRCAARSPSSPACATRSATTCCASGCASRPARGCARRSRSCCRTRWRCGSTRSSPRP